MVIVFFFHTFCGFTIYREKNADENLSILSMKLGTLWRIRKIRIILAILFDLRWLLREDILLSF